MKDMVHYRFYCCHKNFGKYPQIILFLQLADRGFWSYLLKVFFVEPDKKNYVPLESSESASLPSSFLKDSVNLMFCSAGLLSSYLIWGLLQERIMTQVSFNIIN